MIGAAEQGAHTIGGKLRVGRDKPVQFFASGVGVLPVRNAMPSGGPPGTPLARAARLWKTRTLPGVPTAPVLLAQRSKTCDRV